MMRQLRYLILGIAGCLVAIGQLGFAQPQVGFNNGVKIGEVDATSAMIWTRLTNYGRVLHGKDKFPIGPAVEGHAGNVMIRYWVENTKEIKESKWFSVKADKDFTHQFQLTELKPGTRYFFRIIGHAPGNTDRFAQTEGSFTTAPHVTKEKNIKFMVVTGQGYHRRDDDVRGHRIYEKMLRQRPDFFVHTGDIVYYDKKNPVANDLETARFHWHRMYSLPFQMRFHRSTPSYFIKDDHDTLNNDCWPGMKPLGKFTFEMGKDLFREQVPMGHSTYRTVRWGKDLQIWLMEGRDFRSRNPIPDGPDKTIWGKQQIAWLKETAAASNATFKILISPTPIVGPDRKRKNDNHANDGFKTEGTMVRSWLASNKFIVVCGDRHWQYVSSDPNTGLLEFSCGPTSNAHAGGFSKANESEMHKYLRVKGGFFEANVSRRTGSPVFSGTHYSVDGKKTNVVEVDEQLNVSYSRQNRR